MAVLTFGAAIFVTVGVIYLTIVNYQVFFLFFFFFLVLLDARSL